MRPCGAPGRGRRGPAASRSTSDHHGRSRPTRTPSTWRWAAPRGDGGAHRSARRGVRAAVAPLPRPPVRPARHPQPRHRCRAAPNRPSRCWPTTGHHRGGSVHLLEQRHDAGRRWVPIADVPLGPRVIVGRGGVELELTCASWSTPRAWRCSPPCPVRGHPPTRRRWSPPAVADRWWGWPRPTRCHHHRGAVGGGPRGRSRPGDRRRAALALESAIADG